MSIHAIKAYQSEVENIIHYGGTRKETAIRNAFQHLLNEYAKQKGLMLIPEITIKTKDGKNVTPDGTLKDALRQDWGYWESKDEADDIDEEIQKKFGKGYPNDNILFEDSNIAVLYQHAAPVMRVSMKDAEELDKIIHRFMNYERPEVKNFREAIAHFKEDIPAVTKALREIIEQQEDNAAFVKKRAEFLELCKEAINPEVSPEDVKEMMLQHILTADIFNTIFDEPHFHRENNVAKELEKVVDTFFNRTIRQQTLNRIKHYYDTINATAAGIADHHEKQKFLKVVYETFYKSYNPKAADRLGVVYTPNEIVRFMVESTDYLLHKHFGKFLEDKGVEILDPATGTGTFICDIIDHIRKDKLEYKYRNELHANEVAILPYYISNLNIEFTYKQKMGQYAEFEHLCFMDTLDNLGFKRARQNDLFNPFTEENSKRIMRQNSKKMMVVIGNPPYNANQQNENDNNKNREYAEIDQRIKDTFIKNSTAQKTKVYDMYARFYRWSFDRIQENGIIAFITNRSFIESRTFDGFRKTVQDEFDFAYIVDTKSDVRANPRIAGTTHNVFGIQTGVAVMFLVKKEGKKKRNCTISYVTMDDFWRKEEKLAWFAEHKLEEISFEHAIADKKANWINISDNNWESLIPLYSKDVKNTDSSMAIFKKFANGIKTNRDEWVYDRSQENLLAKMEYLCRTYNAQVSSGSDSDNSLDYSIKWSSGLKEKLYARRNINFSPKHLRVSLWRPFEKQFYFSDKNLSDRLTDYHVQIWGKELQSTNTVISCSGLSSAKPFQVLATNTLSDYEHIEKSVNLPLYLYVESKLVDNITDWGLEQFRSRYLEGKGKKASAKKTDAYLKSYKEATGGTFNEGSSYSEVPSIKKEDIFYYVYAVLQNPAYREKYAQNLKRDFPRIPLYNDFWKWRQWGEQLMNLHINYEKVEPYKLERCEIDYANTTPFIQFDKGADKPKLRADKIKGCIIIDGYTELYGVPKEAWDKADYVDHK